MPSFTLPKAWGNGGLGRSRTPVFTVIDSGPLIASVGFASLNDVCLINCPEDPGILSGIVRSIFRTVSWIDSTFCLLIVGLEESPEDNSSGMRSIDNWRGIDLGGCWVI